MLVRKKWQLKSQLLPKMLPHWWQMFWPAMHIRWEIYACKAVCICVANILGKWPHLESFRSAEYQYPDVISTFCLMQVPKQVWVESILPILYISNLRQRKGKPIFVFLICLIFIHCIHNHQNYKNIILIINQCLQWGIFLGEHEATEQTRYRSVQGRR